MPYPATTDPDYCASSRQPVPDYDPTVHWHRCPTCKRPIRAMGKTGLFFPHVSNKKRARKGDSVQEGLIRFGMNKNSDWSSATCPCCGEDGFDDANACTACAGQGHEHEFHAYRAGLEEFYAYRRKILDGQRHG